MKVIKSPVELYYTNFAIVSPLDFNGSIHYVELKTGVDTFIFSIKRSGEVPTGSIVFNLLQREWAVLSLGQDIDVHPFVVDTNQYNLTSIVLEDIMPERTRVLEPYDNNIITQEFSNQFMKQSLSIGQKIFFRFQRQIMHVLVKDLKVVDVNTVRRGSKDSKDNTTFEGKIGFCFWSYCSPIVVTFVRKSEGSL